MNDYENKHPLLSPLTRLACRRRHNTPTKKVAIVIPLRSDEDLDDDERISLAHLQHHLGAYDKFFLLPEGNIVEAEGIKMKHYPRKYFGDVNRHGLLLWDPKLYRDFDDYEFMLFYQLDALVFSDRLEEWCDAGYDFIGPPWLVSKQMPWVKEPGVGNGGLCLVKIRSVLELLYRVYEQDPGRYWMSLLTRHPEVFGPFIDLIRKLKRAFPNSRLVSRPVEEWDSMVVDQCGHARALDVFWGKRAHNYYPDWNVAPFEEGLKFGFEVEPSRCFELNGKNMPFGCHAWGRYERSFWEPHLLQPEGEAV